MQADVAGYLLIMTFFNGVTVTPKYPVFTLLVKNAKKCTGYFKALTRFSIL